MPLPVAMVLSGIERNDWDDFRELYQQGENVVIQDANSRPPSRASVASDGSESSLSTASSGNNHAESGIGSSTSPEEAACSPGQLVLVDNNNHAGVDDDDDDVPPLIPMSPARLPFPLSLRDFCLFRVETKSVCGQHTPSLMDVYDEALKEGKPKSPAGEASKPEAKAAPSSEPYPVNLNITWTNRDLLDLGSNMRGNLGMFTPARIPEGIESFFENRSQISRIRGAFPPPHVTRVCPDCGFEEPVFQR